MFAQLRSITRFSVAATLVALACGTVDSTRPTSSPTVSLNSATVTSALIAEMNLAGVVSDDGVEFVYATSKTGGRYRMTTIDNELAAYGPKGVVAHGAELVGWKLVLRINGKPAEMQIRGYEAGEVNKYAFAIADEQGTMINLCPAFSDQPSLPTATLIGNERYDAETKEVIAEQESWVSFACPGDALSKMKQMGYVPDETKAIHRQATLKMITADYCGTGKSFTEDGTPVIWQNFEGTIGKGAGDGAIEALWNEYGALCLTTPRLAPLDKIAEECTLPLCDDELLAKGADFAWTTWVP